MGYQDRSYSRNPSGGWHPLLWLFTGSVPLFRVFGVNVRMHASLILLVVLSLIFGIGPGYTAEDRVLFIVTLMVVVLLHEFGHIAGARIMGGAGDEVMLTPLGGLAFTQAPRRPLATFVTVAAGPLVNLILMLMSAVAIYALQSSPNWSPLSFVKGSHFGGWTQVTWYLDWFFRLNKALLLFNLLPIFPLDGGQLLQSILWRPLGYYRSMMVSLTLSILLSVLGAMLALATGQGLLLAIMISCLATSYPMRVQIKQAGPWAFGEEEEDYSNSLAWKPEKSRSTARAGKDEQRRRREEEEERAEQVKIDRILEKVGRSGMNSLNWMEKRTLRKATERQRQRQLRR